MKERRISVVWVCHFSDEKIRSHIQFSRLYYKNVLNYLKTRRKSFFYDMAVWISNAIHEFENYDDVCLTIVFPHKGIKGHFQAFEINGINYVCYRSEDDYFWSRIVSKLFKVRQKNFFNNRRIIEQVINNVKPDIVHVIGAENPYYSISALDVPQSIPCVVSLQTLMSDPMFLSNYPISTDEYEFRSSLESKILKSCNYIASPVLYFRDIVKKHINPNAVFLNMKLALGQNIDTTYDEKKYDFVYFAANLSKAGDYAIEAFARVQQQRPDVTLNMSGAISQELKELFDKRIKELGIDKNVFFTGSQPTHDAVLKQIKKSRFAVLPLKVDLISGTIREAMACGLPVVTTITPKTPDLNINRESVLLSQKGDSEAMASNMLRLLDDDAFACKIRDNGLVTIQEQYSNKTFMDVWRKSYLEIYENFNYGKPFSKDLVIE